MNAASDSIALADALQVLHNTRTSEVLLTSMGSGRDWQRFPPHPLDFIQIPSSMGQTPAWGLGLALARPRQRIVACCGDGSLLMNLGCLVTIATAAPANFTLLVFDNGVYEVTGAQATPAARDRLSGERRFGDPPSVDLAAFAEVAGFPLVERIRNIDDWARRAGSLLRVPGPVCAVLKVTPVTQAFSVKSPGPVRARIRQFLTALESC
jgi:thiamine pyrophosphate-dependent acetolactate synthase large subunit-like protein